MREEEKKPTTPIGYATHISVGVVLTFSMKRQLSLASMKMSILWLLLLVC